MGKLRFVLDRDKIYQLKSYIEYVSLQKVDNEITDYWRLETKEIGIKLFDDLVEIKGSTAFNFPPTKNILSQLKLFTKELPVSLSYVIYRLFMKLYRKKYRFTCSGRKAYNMIMNHDSVIDWKYSQQKLSSLGMNNSVLNFREIRGMQKQWPSSQQYLLNDIVIKSYYYLQIMEYALKNLKNSVICEVGAGTGNLASLFKYHFNAKYLIVDLPKTLFFSFIHLSKLFPNKRIALPHNVNKEGLRIDDYDFIMLTPDLIDLIPDRSIDLAVNVHSMQEMTEHAISFYFDLFDRILKNGGAFFCANRIEKIMDGKPNRFFEYPWRQNTKTLLFELDPFYQLVTNNSFYIRLEQYE